MKKNNDIAAAREKDCQRLSRGHYIYRGFEVNCIGYYQPEHRVCWEAVDEHGCGFAHSYSLAMTKILIDSKLDKIINNKKTKK